MWVSFFLIAAGCQVYLQQTGRAEKEMGYGFLWSGECTCLYEHLYVQYNGAVTIATQWKLIVQLFSLSLSPFPFFSWQSSWLRSMPRFANTSKIIPFTSRLRRSVSLWNLKPSLVHWVSQPTIQSCEHTLYFAILSAKLNFISWPGLVSVNNLFLYLFTALLCLFSCFVYSLPCSIELYSTNNPYKLLEIREPSLACRYSNVIYVLFCSLTRRWIWCAGGYVGGSLWA